MSVRKAAGFQRRGVLAASAAAITDFPGIGFTLPRQPKRHASRAK